MRFKLTIFLLLANLVVFFALWRLNQPIEVPPKAGGPIPKDFSPDHILIEDHVHNETRELKYDPNSLTWRIIKPVDWPANKWAVTPIISSLQLPDEKTNFSVADLKSSGQSLATFGLDKPLIEVTLSSGNDLHKEQHKLLIGNSTMYGNNINVMNPEDGLVRVVSQDILGPLSVSLDDLRDKSIFTVSPINIKSLSITSIPAGARAAAPLTRFRRDETQDKWLLDTPFTGAADGEMINNVISQLEGLQATKFVTGNEAETARAGFATPTLKIELKDDTTSQTLSLGGLVPGNQGVEYYARMEDSPTTIFRIPESPVIVKLRDHAQDTLREHQFLDFNPAKVTTIRLQASGMDGQTLEANIQKLEDGRWQILDKGADNLPVRIVADTGVIQTMLKNLRELKAIAFANDAPTQDDLQKIYKLTKPQWKVTLQGEKTQTLDIGFDTSSATVRFYAKVEGSDSVYEIGSEILSQLSVDTLNFRDRTLAAQPVGAQVVSIKLTHLAEDSLTTGDDVLPNYTIDPAKTTWDEFLKDKPQLIRDNLPLLLNWVRNTTVDSYRQASFNEHYTIVQDSLTPTPVPWRYRLDAGVQSGTGSVQVLTFYFSERTAGLSAKGVSRLGGTRDAPLPAAVFVVPTQVSGALGVVTHDFSQPPEVTQAVKEMDQPINPQSAPPATTTGLPTASPASTTGNAAPASAMPAATTAP